MREMLITLLFYLSIFHVIESLKPIPIQTISTLNSHGVQHMFLPEDGMNPLRSLQTFCSHTYTSTEDCRRIADYLVDMMVLDDGYNDSSPISSYQNDIILHDENFNGIKPPYIWGNIQLQIQLDSLRGIKQCSYLLIPLSEVGLDDSINNFCSIHQLKGISCLELNYEIRTYLTSLYNSPDGVTLRNLAKYMITDEELIYMYFLIDVYNNTPSATTTTTTTAIQTSRYYYVSSPTYFAMDGGRFCIDKAFTRSACIEFFEYIQMKVNSYYHSSDTTLPPLLYILYHIQNISKYNQDNIIEKKNSIKEYEEGGYIDADFIEIGTSNFNAITQLIDMNEPIIGYAIEPYAHYLNQLPSPPGVKKLNLAIIPDHTMRDNKNTTTTIDEQNNIMELEKEQEYVDMYYIPEEVIDTLKLPPFLKGCNSIGGIHAMHFDGGFQEYVQKQSVPAVTITQLLTSQRIRSVRLLKIDAELYDYIILKELYQYLVARQDTILYPQRILFEVNPYEVNMLQELLLDYQNIGYSILYIADDVIMEYPLNPI